MLLYSHWIGDDTSQAWARYNKDYPDHRTRPALTSKFKSIRTELLTALLNSKPEPLEPPEASAPVKKIISQNPSLISIQKGDNPDDVDRFYVINMNGFKRVNVNFKGKIMRVKYTKSDWDPKVSFEKVVNEVTLEWEIPPGFKGLRLWQNTELGLKGVMLEEMPLVDPREFEK